MECSSEFGRIAPRHVAKHGLTLQQYREKWPDALLVSPEVTQKITSGNTGKSRSLETRAKISKRKREQYSLDQDLKNRISKGTKLGMRLPEAWQKFQDHIRTRDVSDFSLHFKSYLPETKAKMYTLERNKKVSESKMRWWADGRSGKTVEELYGVDVGRHIRRVRSEQTQGEKNPAFGKVYKRAGRGKVGRYRGLLFRSTWEYSFLKFVEAWGIDVTNEQQLCYEYFSIKYQHEGRNRTYHPDFFFPEFRLLVEIKTQNELGRHDKAQFLESKFSAAEKFCLENDYTFLILTERYFPILKFKEICEDPDVEWIRR